MRINILQILRRNCSDSSVSYKVVPKPFSSIPGPKAVPILGTIWKYLPIVGNYDFLHLDKTGSKKLEEFGNLVKERIAGVYFLTVFDADDISKVYQAEGRYPERRSHLAVEHQRLSRPHLYNTGGLLPTNGKEWWRLRSAFQRSLSRIQDVRLFLPVSDEITSEFLREVIKPGEIIDDALPLLARLNLELTWFAMFGERLNSFGKDQLRDDSIPSQLIHAAETANTSILGTDNTEVIWKKFKTPLFKRLEKSLNFIEKNVVAAVNRVQAGIERKGEKDQRSSLIEDYLNCSEVDVKDVYGMAVDLILGGVDTTTYTSGFILHHLGVNKNKAVQDKLRQETMELLDTPDSVVTNSILNKAAYTRAVLKETFRLNPIAVGISRIVKEDIILSGYFVPKGTVVLTQNQVACRLEKNFTKASEFIPERWIRNSDFYQPVSPFLVLPFSHGPRTCIARRLAEQNLLTLILKVIRRYEVKWLGGELGILTPLINKPDQPIKMMFSSL